MKKLRLILPVLLAGIVLAFVVTGGFGQAPQDEGPRPPPWATPPAPFVRTVVPGPKGGGIFADDVNTVPPQVDTSGWKTYENKKFGYSFKYPPSWVITSESDSSDCRGPGGRLCFPIQHVSFTNPREEWAAPPGCEDETCLANAPKLLQFGVEIIDESCPGAGDIVVQDKVTLNSKSVDRCIALSDFDKRVRGVAVAFRYTTDLFVGREFFLVVYMSKGATVTPAEQSILDAMLTSFRFGR